jgi:hypothetical protein
MTQNTEGVALPPDTTKKEGKEGGKGGIRGAVNLKQLQY